MVISGATVVALGVLSFLDVPALQGFTEPHYVTVEKRG
jgi:hypothetical protein